MGRPRGVAGAPRVRSHGRGEEASPIHVKRHSGDGSIALMWISHFHVGGSIPGPRSFVDFDRLAEPQRGDRPSLFVDDIDAVVEHEASFLDVLPT